MIETIMEALFIGFAWSFMLLALRYVMRIEKLPEKTQDEYFGYYLKGVK